MTKQWRVGEVSVRPVTDFDDQPWALAWLLPGSDPALLDDETFAPPGTVDTETQSLRLRFGGHVIVSAGVNILVDCGVGAGKVRPNRGEWHMRSDTSFLDSLSEQGFSPEDIDVVVITHAHLDHVGWLTVRDENAGWVPTFTKAEHIFVGAELDHWMTEFATNSDANFGSIADSVAPVVDAARVRRVDDGYEITPEVSLTTYPGHTPGSAVVWVQSGGECAAICGDLIHHPIQLRHPDLSTQFCNDKEMSAVSRRRFLDDVVEREAYLMPNHFRLEPMRIGKRDDHYFPLNTI